jgi:ubiquinone/menaquinone biosynthesis C-methylase UbiE
METTNKYIPALKYHWLTPLYDPLIHRLMREDVLRERLVLEADILPGMRVLDLGCGTDTLTILIKRSHVMAQVFGLDADPQVLNLARLKAAQVGARITLEQGMAYKLPFPDGWFDRVLSSLVFHHLTTGQKQQAFSEVLRVLRPGGKFTILDVGVPRSVYSRLVSQVMRLAEQAEANVRGLLPEMMKLAGFVSISEIEQFTSLFGNLTMYQAEIPAQPTGSVSG